MADDRKQYWNQSYLDYWKSRVDESTGSDRESGIVSGDLKTEGDEVYEDIFAKHPPHPGTILDVGCAWGRMFPVFKKLGLKITGIDISKAMIDQAKKDFGNDPAVELMLETEAESLGMFKDNQFDNVACLAVFDALYQNKALAEFLRVLKMDGYLYLTGKNDNYPDDDDPAYRAEVGARGKNHPNYFTDAPKMIEMIKEQGHTILGTYFYERRGDFGSMKAVTTMPAKFYEYFIVVQKKAPHEAFEPFSDAFSKTFKRLPQ